MDDIVVRGEDRQQVLIEMPSIVWEGTGPDTAVFKASAFTRRTTRNLR